MVAADLLFIRDKKQNRQQRGFRERFNPSFLSTTPSSLSISIPSFLLKWYNLSISSLICFRQTKYQISRIMLENVYIPYR